MGEIIRVNSNRKPSMIICSKCKKEVLIDITPFAKDITNVMQDKCPGCGAQIFVGVLILSHPELKGLLQCIMTVIEALKPGNMNLVDKQ